MEDNETIIVDADDLEIFTDSDRETYFNKFLPTVTNLCYRMKRGTYDHTAAIKAFMPVVNAGAENYLKEFPNSKITVSVRREVAEDLQDRFEAEYKLGNYNYLVE